ncbi:hypothetical protein DPMN_127799 [Dreissena polymorpha]|uniref:Uncharacterized protein n=1 Tax=Dreissena polymorpha TaxID=45954 RepID=A0A9D4H1X0_DREPO|nr:hypothetical protein DPMN_127799 [Dreissena polymorpha]
MTASKSSDFKLGIMHLSPVDRCQMLIISSTVKSTDENLVQSEEGYPTKPEATSPDLDR